MLLDRIQPLTGSSVAFYHMGAQNGQGEFPSRSTYSGGVSLIGILHAVWGYRPAPDVGVCL